MATYWTQADQRSVVIISGLKRDAIARPGSDEYPSDAFEFVGNGFIVYVDDEATWIVTCAHVVADFLGRPLRVDNCDAALVSDIDPGIDLAVLRVRARLNGEPLALIGRHSGSGWIPGWEYVDRKDWRASALDTEVGRKDCIKRDPATEQYVWALKVRGFADSTDGCFDPRAPRLIKGFSGAPVICPVRRAVFAVARQMSDDGQAGYGICIEHLQAIWPADAPKLAWLDQREQPLHDEDEQRLARILKDLPAGLTLADLRRHVQRCAPEGLTLDVPGGDDPQGFLSWLLVAGQLRNGHVPLFDVLACLRPALVDQLEQQRLQHICDALVGLYPQIVVSQPDLVDTRSDSIALRVELIDPGGGQRGAKRYDLTVERVVGGTDPPQRIAVREGNPGQRFCPTNDEDIGFFFSDLIEEWLPDDLSSPEHLMLSFRLPDALLDLPVDTWRRYPDDPDDDRLGSLFPVLVQAADRHRGKVAMAFWRRSWDALSARLHEPLSASLCLCAVDTLRTCASSALKQGCGIGVSSPLCLTETANKRVIDSLLRTHGAAVVIWPRDAATAERLRDALANVLADTPLHTLPVALREFRASGADDRSRPELEITLLWDPPPEDAGRPSLHGISQ